MNDEREAQEELEGSLFVEDSSFQTNEALRKSIHIVTGLLVISLKAPDTAAELAKASPMLPPAARMASKMLTVPTTLTMAPSGGSAPAGS